MSQIVKSYLRENAELCRLVILMGKTPKITLHLYRGTGV